MTKLLTWLHLSDLHLTCKKDSEDWTIKSINQDIVIRSLLEAIQELLIEKDQKPDLVFITGDLVRGGKPDEYKVATEFCDQLLKITNLSKQQLFIVPGNHDVNRDEINPAHKKRLYLFDDQDGISDILSDSELSPILMKKLDAFYKFHNEFFCQESKFNEHFTIAKPIIIDGTDSKINLLGLNSALFAGYNGDDEKKLAFGLHQSSQAFQTIDKNAALTIAFFHHPFSCFHTCEDTTQSQIKQHADVILTGHLHDPSNMSQHDDSGKVVIIGAGASYETRKSENSFNLCVLNLETGEGKVQFYKYIHDKNRWTKNTDVNLDEEDGHFPFSVSSIQERPSKLKNEKQGSIEQNKEIEDKHSKPDPVTLRSFSRQIVDPIIITPLEEDSFIIFGSENIPDWKPTCEREIEKTQSRSSNQMVKPQCFQFNEEGNIAKERISISKYRANDPKCLGVVCIVEQGIGFPIEDSFEINQILHIEQWTDEDSAYRLLHPWPNNQKTSEESIAKGCFPLTRTVFNLIEAFESRKPFRLVIVDNNIIENSESTLEGQEQSQSSNFIAALKERAQSNIETIHLDNLKFSIKSFVSETLQIDSDNPYLALDFYNIDDSNSFHGRDDEINEAVNTLIKKLKNPNETAIIQIKGNSGCGKSSLLRAGVLSKIKEKKLDCNYMTVVFRPTDFHNQNGLATQVLTKLLEEIDEQTDLNIPKKFKPKGSMAPQQILVKLEELLLSSSTKNKRTKLVIGIDQFEEIVDDLNSIKHKTVWEPLISLIEACTNNDYIGFIYTLESSRETTIKSSKSCSHFTNHHSIKLDTSDKFLTAIISEPFMGSGYKLENGIINELINNTKKLPDDTGSVLPLLALKLTNIYAKVSDKDKDKDKSKHQKSSKGISNKFSNVIIIKKHDLIENRTDKDPLDLTSQLNDLAQLAWTEGGGPSDKDIDKKNEQLDHFLQPLVRTTPNGEHLILETIGDRPYPSELNLDKSFAKYRLLVPVDGRYRLVHEAVIHRWEDAEKWLDHELPFLKMEAKFLEEAEIWDKKNRDDGYLRIFDPAYIKEEVVDDAAHILNKYLRLWSMSQHETMNDHDQLLKDYCIKLFEFSETPVHQVSTARKRQQLHVHLAAAYGRNTLLEKFYNLDNSCLEVSDSKGGLPLHNAAWYQTDTVKYLLLDKKVNPVSRENSGNIENKIKGWNAIICAIQMGKDEIFNLLLSSDDCSKEDLIAYPDNQTALHLCASYGQCDMAKQIIKSFEVSPDEQDKRGWIPLHTAAYSGKLEIFSYFLTLLSNEKWNSSTYEIPLAIHLAVGQGHILIVEEIIFNENFTPLFLESRFKNGGDTPLMIAAEFSFDQIVECLLRAGSNPNTYNTTGNKQRYTALHLAIDSYSRIKASNRAKQQMAFRIIKSLLSSEFDTNPNLPCINGKTSFALASNLPNVLQLLLDHPKLDLTSTTEKGWTPLMIASKSGNRNMVENLLKNPEMLIEQYADDGTSAAYLMIKNDMSDLALKLIKNKNVNPWGKNQQDHNLLSASIEENEKDLIDEILDLYPKEPNEFEELLLNHSLKTVHTSNKLMYRLIEMGANPNISLSDIGNTHLFVAAMLGEIDIVNKLLEYPKVQPAIRDAWNRSPTDYASDHLQDKINKMIGSSQSDKKINSSIETTKPKAIKLIFGNEFSNHQKLIQTAKVGSLDTYSEILGSLYTNPNFRDTWNRTSVEFAPDAQRQKFQNLLNNAIESYNLRKDKS